MSIIIAGGSQRLNSSKTAQSLDYGCFGPFASRTKGISLPSALFDQTLSFLAPEDLRAAEEVCPNWSTCIKSTEQWKKQCQYMLGLLPSVDPKEYLSKSLTHKENARMILSSILGKSVWRRYIGDIGLVPPIPEEISLRNWNKPDPCDPSSTIGKEYIWLYCPSHIVTNLKDFVLSGPDDPRSPEAAKLIEKTGSIVQKVPVTIHNIGKLFKRPKTGHSSMYCYIWPDILEQHGNKKIQPGWRCMRKSVIGRRLPFVRQQELAKVCKVVITQLQARIVYNFLEHARSNVYPDGRNPRTVARTSTLTRDEQGVFWSSGCGIGGSSGLEVSHDRLCDGVDVGIGVMLSAEV